MDIVEFIEAIKNSGIENENLINYHPIVLRHSKLNDKEIVKHMLAYFMSLSKHYPETEHICDEINDIIENVEQIRVGYERVGSGTKGYSHIKQLVVVWLNEKEKHIESRALPLFLDMHRMKDEDDWACRLCFYPGWSKLKVSEVNKITSNLVMFVPDADDNLRTSEHANMRKMGLCLPNGALYIGEQDKVIYPSSYVESNQYDMDELIMMAKFVLEVCGDDFVSFLVVHNEHEIRESYRRFAAIQRNTDSLLERAKRAWKNY